ncbi:uncharacterized protein BYT42DRAFT_610776 [Radiomyces spectabilis]|uniref:uncharacterized protein n=1 Tax=Radiomyces spectabilis TaxID=64574 RepID=UPI00222072AD|nr:uncharacterized protein BYT42DRAFT_610776 [Radiomyces spectabilis]KAI8391563.1 hypothetical protein BYT42DRAFT_610776 [Radiomyces spectabilis]
MSWRSRARRQQRATSAINIPLPQFKKDVTSVTRRHKPMIDEALAIANLQTAFHLRLQSIVRTAKVTDDMKKPEKADKSLAKKKAEIAQAKHVPRGVWELADKVGIDNGSVREYGTTSNSVRATVSQCEAWKAYALEHFDSVAAATDLRLLQKAKKENELQLRTCSLKLQKLFRSDLPTEMVDHFMETLDKTAILLTDDIGELSAIVRATMLRYVSSTTTTGYPLASLIPAAAIRDSRFLNHENCLPVDPPQEFEDDNEDYTKLFTQEHIQYIHQQYLGSSQTSSAEKHPVWKELHVDGFGDAPKMPRGLSHTTGSAVQIFARNTMKMWSGAIVNKAAEYVVRILLRLILAPTREAVHQSMIKKMSEKKKEQATNRALRSNRDVQRNILYFEKKYYHQCENHLTRCRDEEEYQKWQTRLYQSQVRLARLDEQWKARKERTQGSMSLTEFREEMDTSDDTNDQGQKSHDGDDANDKQKEEQMAHAVAMLSIESCEDEVAEVLESMEMEEEEEQDEEEDEEEEAMMTMNEPNNQPHM